jgi:putative transposase
MLARRHARRSRPRSPGRPRTVRSVRVLVLRLVRENPGWGYRRVHGELLVLEVKVAASTVWEILHEAGIDPAPERGSATWADFLRSQAEALLACDFFETVTLSGARLHVLAVIEHVQPQDKDSGRHCAPDGILADAGVQTVLSGIQLPRMNSIIERWVQTCRRELLDRTLIWNQSHLLRRQMSRIADEQPDVVMLQFSNRRASRDASELVICVADMPATLTGWQCGAVSGWMPGFPGGLYYL